MTSGATSRSSPSRVVLSTTRGSPSSFATRAASALNVRSNKLTDAAVGVMHNLRRPLRSIEHSQRLREHLAIIEDRTAAAAQHVGGLAFGLVGRLWRRRMHPSRRYVHRCTRHCRGGRGPMRAGPQRNGAHTSKHDRNLIRPPSIFHLKPRSAPSYSYSRTRAAGRCLGGLEREARRALAVLLALPFLPPAFHEKSMRAMMLLDRNEKYLGRALHVALRR